MSSAIEMIREATEHDIPALVNIHAAALPEDLLPRLGRRFLRKRFYTSVLASKHALTVVEAEEGLVRSFIVFTLDSAALTAEVTRSKGVLACYVVAGGLRDRALLGEVLAHMRGFETRLDAPLDRELNEIPEIFVMATCPEHHSLGIGSELVRAGLRMLPGGDSACLVKTSSPRARAFYERNGFRGVGSEDRRGRVLHVLLHDGPI